MEEIILKNLLLDQEYYAKVFPHLKNNHFGQLENSEIFKAMIAYNTQYDTSPNIKELGLFIKNSGTVSESLRNKVLTQYKEVMLEPPVENKEFLLDQTEKYIQKEELSDAIFKSADIIENDEPFEPIIGMIEKALSVNFDYDTGMIYKEESSLINRYNYYTERISGLSLGLSSIDRALGRGLRSKTLNVVVAPSHGGKCQTFNTHVDIYLTKEKKELFDGFKQKNIKKG